MFFFSFFLFLTLFNSHPFFVSNKQTYFIINSRLTQLESLICFNVSYRTFLLSPTKLATYKNPICSSICSSCNESFFFLFCAKLPTFRFFCSFQFLLEQFSHSFLSLFVFLNSLNLEIKHAFFFTHSFLHSKSQELNSFL